MQTQYKYKINWNSFMNNATAMGVLNVFMHILSTLFQLINCNHFILFLLYFIHSHTMSRTVLFCTTFYTHIIYIHEYTYRIPSRFFPQACSTFLKLFSIIFIAINASVHTSCLYSVTLPIYLHIVTDNNCSAFIARISIKHSSFQELLCRRNWPVRLFYPKV